MSAVIGPVDTLLSLHISKTTPIPVYVQITDRIRALLREMVLLPGTLLPPERVMCERIGVSKMTLRHAYGLLEREGLIESRRGVGTYVCQPRMEKKLPEMRSFSEEMAARGQVASSRFLYFHVAKPDFPTQQFFGLANGEPVYEIRRLRLGDDIPIAIETVKIPVSLVPRLEKIDLQQKSLYRVLEDTYGIYLTRCHEEIAAAIPDSTERKLLRLDRSVALLVIKRESYAADDLPVELATTAYNGDRYKAGINAVRMR